MSEAEKFRAQIIEKIKVLDVKSEPVKKVEEVSLPKPRESVKVRIYWPIEGKKTYPVMYIHGASFVAGSLDSHDNICRYISNRSGRVVASVGYRLAPEYKFPIGFEDCKAAFNWLRGRGGKLQSDTDKIFLVGDSAGGTFVAALSNMLKKDGRASEAPFQVLINPVLDLRPGGVTYRTYKPYVEMYFKDARQDSLDEFASPLLATDFRKLPQSLIVTSEKDEIKNDGERYFKALTNARVETTIYEMPNIGHLGVHWAAAHPLAENAMSITVGALRSVD